MNGAPARRNARIAVSERFISRASSGVPLKRKGDDLIAGIEPRFSGMVQAKPIKSSPTGFRPLGFYESEKKCINPHNGTGNHTTIMG